MVLFDPGADVGRSVVLEVSESVRSGTTVQLPPATSAIYNRISIARCSA